MINSIFKELTSATKPVAKMMRQGQDYKVQRSAQDDLSILSIQLSGETRVFRRQGKDLKCLCIGFRKGMILPKHKSNVPTRLVVLIGEVEFYDPNGSTTLSLFDEYEIPVEEMHWVEAREESLILLIKNK